MDDRQWAGETLELFVSHESPSGAVPEPATLRDILVEQLRSAGG